MYTKIDSSDFLDAELPSYYPSLDELTKIYEKGMITLVTGRTSQAKTSFVLNLIVEQLLNNPDAVCLWVEFPRFTSHTAYWLRLILAHKKFDGDEKKAIAQLLEWANNHRFLVPEYANLRDIEVLIQVIPLLTNKYGVTHCYIDSARDINAFAQTESSANNKQDYLDEEASIIMSRLSIVARQASIPITLIAAGKDYWLYDGDDNPEKLRRDIDVETYLDDLLYSFEYYMYSKIILGLELLESRKIDDESSRDLIVYLLKDNSRPNKKIVMDFYGPAVTVSEK